MRIYILIILILSEGIKFFKEGRVKSSKIK